MTAINLDPFTQGAVDEATLSLNCMPWHLAAEALARIVEDCARDQRVGKQLNLAGNQEDRTSKKAGRAYWAERQSGSLHDDPPVRLFLAEDGLIHIAEGDA